MKEYEYIILDENDEVITDPDLTLGYLKKETLTIHVPTKSAITHKWITAIYFKDGTTLHPKEGDPHITYENGELSYQFLPGETPKEIRGKLITDIIDVPEESAHFEYKKIYRYILYTEQELMDKEFISTTPARLDTIETGTDELIEVVAELAGSDIEERVGEAQETLDDLLLAVADILGGADE